MSTKWNKRTDEYGGRLENRMRFTLECLESIQKYCGKDYPVIVKYNPSHATPDGRQLPEGLEIAKMLEEAGAHALHVDKGCYDCWYNAITTVYQPDAHQIELAEAVKKVVKIPVIAQGKLYKPEVAEKVLQEGKTDFVAIGHQLLADAHWPNKVKEGRIKDIIPCIGCNECLKHFFASKHLNCSVNPHSFHEDHYPITPAKNKKKVLVIGGGPGGIEAALAASEKGHNVVLWEKDAQLGGLLLAAGAPSFKYSVMNYVKYMIRKVDRSNVNVQLLKEATPEKVLAGGFDEVIIATGAQSVVPPIEGINGSQVYSAIDVLTDKACIEGANVVVIGGGLVGCETAVHLAMHGKNVTVVEMLSDILITADHTLNNDQALRTLITENNVKVYTGAKVIAITEDGVEIEKDEKRSIIACEQVVLACGF
ncbi:MAG: FAD-dependent oxidoreductase [Dethiobacteria bacterium]